MRDYKILLISFVLFIFMIGAVSAADGDNILTDDDPGAVIPDEPIIVVDDEDESNVKEIYVSDTGDDSNDGSEDSPYATIARAVEDVTEIDEATIHIAEGTYASDGDSNLNINLMQQYNGNANLKFIGAGADKTIIDAQDAFNFANFGECTRVTLKDITFINCKGSDGGAVSSYGILNVENCIFKDCYSLEGCGGAIHAGTPEEWGFDWTLSLNVKNSQFINCFDNSVEGWYDERGGGAIYAGTLQECCIDNNTFIGTSISEDFGKGAAVFSWMSNSKIINNKFINITGYQNDGGLAADSWMGVNVEIINNTFINCSNPSDEYAIVYLGFADEYNIQNNTFINSENPAGNCYYTTGLNILGLKYEMDDEIINVGNSEINEGAPISISATDDNGNKFAVAPWSALRVNLANENNSYTFSTSNNKIVFNVVPENGVYNLTVSDSDVLGIVNINASNDPFDLYVSPSGSDADEGTVEAPFATIQHAIDVGFEKSFTVVVHLLKGTYSGEGNVMLNIANKGNLQLIGEKYNETVIDGNNTDWLVSVRTTQVTAENLTFSNGKATSRNSVLNNLFLKDCIVDGNDATGSQSVMSGVNFENLIYTNNKGHISIHRSEITISDCYFANNNCSNNNFGVLEIESWGQPVIVENCIFINNTAKNSGAAIYSNSPLISINNHFEGNSAPSSAVFVLSPYYVHTFENDTYINNKATAGNGAVVAADESDRRVSSYQFNNCRFINNSAVKGGAIAIVNGNVSDSEFINNTADYGGAVLIVPIIIDQYEPLTNNGINFENVTFDNNVANVNGHDLYFGREFSYQTYDFGCFSLDFKFNDLNVSSLTDTLTVNVTAPFDAVIGGGFVDFELNGTKIGTGEIVNGIASFNYPGFEEGVYVLGGKSEYGDDSSTFTNGTVTVKFESILDNIEYWVSSEGSDEDGNGSEANPFNSISYAVNKASKSSRNILIRISEGTFAGDLNTALELSSMYNITLSGAGVDKTIIDGENSTYFATVTEGKNKVVISDLTIKNMLPDNRNNKVINSFCPITIEEGGNLLFNNVEIVDNHGGEAIIKNYGNLYINNSVFKRNGFSTYGIIADVSRWGIGSIARTGNITIDNTLFEDNYVKSIFISADNLIINNSEFKNIYTISDSKSAYQLSFDLLNGNSYAYGNVTVENTKISHEGSVEELNALGVNTDGKFVNPALAINGNLNMVNSSMINNYNGTLNTDAQVASLAYLSVLGYAYGPSRDINVYNSTFINYQYIWVSNSGFHNFTFDGCLFENFENIAYSRNYRPDSIYDFTNSVFLNCTPLIKTQHYASQPIPTSLNFNDNYWGNNSKPTISFLGNGGIADETYSPDTWIILTSEDGKNINKTLTDGENTTNYTGIAPIRVGFADDNGSLGYAVVFGPVGYLFTTDDDNNVIFNESAAIYPFVDVDPMNYRDNAIMDINKINGSGAVFGSIFDVVGNPVANATIVYTLDGVEANTTTDDDGKFVVFGGNGDLNITFIGNDNYFPIEKVLTLENIAPVKTETALDTTISGDLNITSVLRDVNGNPIAGAVITYVVNGTEVNVTTDDKGEFVIPADNNVTVSISYPGDISYLPTSVSIGLDSLSSTRIATKIEADYTFTRDANDYAAGERGAMFYAVLKDINGNPLKNMTCYVAVNGPIYEVTTDDEGKFGVNVNLAAANTYTYALSFLGNDKYEASLNCSKLVLVAKKTSISASAKTFKATAKTKSVSVTLKTIKNAYDGKTYLKAGKKLTMKVNGKTYTAKINAKGVAKFNIKLTKKGKYTAKISFAGDSTYKACSKSIKITIK